MSHDITGHRQQVRSYDALFGFEDQESRSRIKKSTHTAHSREVAVAGGRPSILMSKRSWILDLGSDHL